MGPARTYDDPETSGLHSGLESMVLGDVILGNLRSHTPGFAKGTNPWITVDFKIRSPGGTMQSEVELQKLSPQGLWGSCQSPQRGPQWTLLGKLASPGTWKQRAGAWSPPPGDRLWPGPTQWPN